MFYLVLILSYFAVAFFVVVVCMQFEKPIKRFLGKDFEKFSFLKRVLYLTICVVSMLFGFGACVLPIALALSLYNGNYKDACVAFVLSVIFGTLGCGIWMNDEEE